MKVSLSWLRDYVAIDMPAEELAHMLTMTGFEVEGLENRFAYLDTVLTASIESIAPHPNADKLKLCRVRAAERTFQVVCGAPNAAVGLLAPLALPGTELPNGSRVAENSIRGTKSEGMLCSQAELGLGADRSGLMTLPQALSSGQPLNTALGIDDAVMEINITPNRPDGLSIIGIAREVAGFLGVPVKKAALNLNPSGGRIEDLTSVRIDAPAHCPRYAARLLEGITVGPSPFWLQDRLLSIGLRPINNIVDITNFVMMEVGQPLHAFDFDRLEENRIVVRTAAPGERFTTLDGKEHQLNADALMICDGRKPVAIGGVMGGMNSEIEPATQRVLIESAYFNPISIRKTAKLLGLKTEASHRFERGVDPHGTRYALDRAAQLMTELGGGKLVDGCIDVVYDLPAQSPITLSAAAANRALGTRLTRDEMADLLEKIEFKVKPADEDRLSVTAPSFRVDVSRPEDLMEEIARRAGYDRIPVTFPTIPAVTRPLAAALAQRQRIRELMSGMGFNETITYSFVHADACRRLRLPEDDPRCRQLAILNPLSEDQTVMRTSLLPGLLEVMKRNMARQIKTLKLFETGKIFISKGNDQQPQEIQMLAGLWTGERSAADWHTQPEPCDFYELKGAVEGLLEGLHIPAARFTALPDDQCAYTRPGASARILADAELLGIIGELHPQVIGGFELKQTAFIFELYMDRLLKSTPDEIQYQPLPKYPAIARDATLIVEKATEAGSLLEQIRLMNEPLVEEARLFDIFEGLPIAEGYKSVSLRIVYRSAEGTLEDATVNQLHKQITDHLVKHFKAALPT